MKFGHTTGTKQEKTGASDWYKAIEAEHIARVEAQDDAERATVTALATQVGNAVSAMPEAASRITKAATLVQSKQVWPLGGDSWLVAAQSHATEAYLVHRHPAWTCTCDDYAHRATTCKHMFAVMFTVKLGATYEPSYT